MVLVVNFLRVSDGVIGSKTIVQYKWFGLIRGGESNWMYWSFIALALVLIVFYKDVRHAKTQLLHFYFSVKRPILFKD